MLQFDSLLDTYSKLRKRKYSLKEALLAEETLKANTAWNKAYQGIQSVDQLPREVQESPGIGSLVQALLQQGQDATSKVPPGTVMFDPQTRSAFMTNPVTGKVETMRGASDIKAVQNDLKARQNKAMGVDEGGEDDETTQEALPVVKVEDIMPRDVQAKNAGLGKRLGEKLYGEEHGFDTSLPFVALDRAIFDTTQGQGTQLHALAGAFELGGVGEPVQQEAIDEFNDDLNTALDAISEHIDSGDKCIDMEPMSDNQKSALSRFCMRGAGENRELRYGNWSNEASTQPLFHEHIERFYQGETGDAKRRAKTYGPQICKPMHKSQPNVIFDAFNTLSKTEQCGNPKKRGIASTGAVERGGGYAAVRGKWGEQISVINAVTEQCIELEEMSRNPDCGKMLDSLIPVVDKILDQVEKYILQTNLGLERIYGGDYDYDTFATEEIASIRALIGPIMEAKEVGGDTRKTAEILLLTLMKQERADSKAMAINGDTPRATLTDPKTGKPFADDTGYTKGDDGVWREEKRDTVYCYSNPGSAETYMRNMAQRDGIELTDESLSRARETNCVGISDKTVEAGWGGEISMGNKGIESEFGDAEAREISANIAERNANDMRAAGVSEEDVEGFLGMHQKRKEFYDEHMHALDGERTGDELTVGAGESKSRPSGPQSPQDLKSDLEEKEKMYPRGSDAHQRITLAEKELENLEKLSRKKDIKPSEIRRQKMKCMSRLENVWAIEQSEGSKYPKETKGDPNFAKHWTVNRIMVGKASDETPVKTRELGGRTRVGSSSKATTGVAAKIYDGNYEVSIGGVNGTNVHEAGTKRKVGSAAQRFKTGRSAGFWDVESVELYGAENRTGDTSYNPRTGDVITANHKQVMDVLNQLIQEIKVLKSENIRQ